MVFDCPEPDDAAFEDSLQRQLRGLDLPAHWIALVRRGGRRLTARAAESLADAGAGLVGVDADSVDDEPHPVHRLLLTRGILIAENLLGLERLGPGVVECCLLPLALTGVDAAPVRAVAWRESRA
jgi:kynurenine formamidase